MDHFYEQMKGRHFANCSCPIGHDKMPHRPIPFDMYPRILFIIMMVYVAHSWIIIAISFAQTFPYVLLIVKRVIIMLIM